MSLTNESAFRNANVETKKVPPVDKDPEARKKSNEFNDRNSSQLRGSIEPSTSERTELSIEVEKGTHRIVIKVIDVDTREVVREIPPERLQQAAKAFPLPSGVLLNESL